MTASISQYDMGMFDIKALKRLCSDEHSSITYPLSFTDSSGQQWTVFTNGHVLVGIRADIGAAPASFDLNPAMNLPADIWPVSFEALRLWCDYPRWDMESACEECDTPLTIAAEQRNGFIGVAALDRNLLARAMSVVPIPDTDTIQIAVTGPNNPIVLESSAWRICLMGVRWDDDIWPIGFPVPRFEIESKEQNQ